LVVGGRSLVKGGGESMKKVLSGWEKRGKHVDNKGRKIWEGDGGP